MSTSFNYTDQVVLVTGASGTLGTATVKQFHNAGATVCMSARHPPEGSETEALLNADHVHFYDADFTDEDDVGQIFHSILNDHGHLGTLCTLIGAWRGGTSLDETDIEEFEFLMNVNLETMFIAAKHGLPHLRESNGNLVSVSARTSLEGVTEMARIGQRKPVSDS